MIIIRRLRKAVLITALILVFEVASLLPQRGIPNSLPAEDTQESQFRSLREAMVKEQIADPPDYRTPVRDRKVLDAMLAVPRHLFVNPSSMSMAYADHPFPIGFGQTISQPYIVALMTEMLEIEPGHKVLEVGTGSGYHAAVLSRLAAEVYSVEIVEPLGRRAAQKLRDLGYSNVHVMVADGYHGWNEHAPFDSIIVTCAATMVPPPLIKQLKPGGRMCIPVGSQYAVQQLTMVEKTEKGEIIMRKILPVRFVPLLRSTDKTSLQPSGLQWALR